MEDGPKTLLEAIEAYSNENNCIQYLAAQRWPDGVVVCPTCGKPGAGFLQAQNRWQCSNRHPRRQFSVKVGTVMEDSPIALSKWLPVFWLIANCRNGISSWELHRDLGVTQKTAWFMLQRVRLAMQDDLTGGMLSGEVEVDETFIGGKVRNMHRDKKRRVQKHSQKGDKAIVLGIVERAAEGKPKRVRATVIADRKSATMKPEILAHIEPGSQVFSDEFGATWTSEQFIHEAVNHLSEYVRGNVHTNSAENFWSLLKRSLGGTYIAVEPFHLFRYVDEQAFRFNNRMNIDGEKKSDYQRFKSLVSQIVGKRLTYLELTGGERPAEAC
jgi:transposase-like protein